MADLMAPAMQVLVNDHELGEDVTIDIISAAYEHTLDLISKLTLVVRNSGGARSDSDVFAPGNEVEIRLGYGPDISFVGRGEIVRHLPDFPSDGVPVLEIVAYDRGWRMVGQELELSGGSSKRPQRSKKESGTRHTGTVGTVVESTLNKYGIEPDVHNDLSGIALDVLQRKGQNDYEFLRALANVHDAELVIEWETGSSVRGLGIGIASASGSGRWVGRFRPAGERRQKKKYIFKYGTGADSTMISCSLEYGMPASPTEIQVWVFDREKKDWVQISEEKTKSGRVQTFSVGTFVPGGEADEIESMTELRLAVAGHSVEVQTRPFATPAEAADWAKRWFKRRKDSFVLATVTVPGVETLRAGQVHRLEGLGRRLEGDYFVSSATHRFSTEGYTTELVGRKVIEE